MERPINLKSRMGLIKLSKHFLWSSSFSVRSFLAWCLFCLFWSEKNVTRQNSFFKKRKILNGAIFISYCTIFLFFRGYFFFQTRFYNNTYIFAWLTVSILNRLRKKEWEELKKNMTSVGLEFLLKLNWVPGNKY